MIKYYLIIQYILRDFFKKIIFFEISFLKPPPKKILVFDKKSINHAKALFPKSSLTFFNTRIQGLNIYVVIVTLLKLGFKNFSMNYKKIYFNLVNPEIVYTAIDNSLSFYRLKNESFSNAIYISDQNGMRNNSFYQEAKKYRDNNKNLSLKCDIFFVLGNNEKKKLQNIINSNFYAFGSTKNNFYLNNKRKKIIKNLVFFSNLPIVKFAKDIILFKNAIKFSKKYNYKLFFIDRLQKNYLPFLKEHFNLDDFTYVSPKSSSETYSFFTDDNFSIFNHSSLGYEFIARGLKGISFGHNSKYILHEKNRKKYPNEGIFWTKKIDYKNFEKKILTIIKYNPIKWKSGTFKYSKELMCYDKSNVNKKKIINNFKIKNK